MKFHIKLILFAGSVLFLFHFSSSVSALTLGPVKFTLSAERGETLEKKIVLYNETNEPLKLITDIANITFAPGDKGVPIPAGIFGSDSLANWITISAKKPVILLPKERKEIPFTITIPKNALSGGYYAKIGWSPVIQEAGKIRATEQIASIILLRVEGDIKESAEIEFFGNHGTGTRFEKMPIPFLVRIRNTGTVHVAPSGEIKIFDYKGSAIDRLSFNQGEQVSYILPNETRAFDLTWKSGFRFGKYTAVLDVVYGENMQDLRMQYTFWIIPTYLLTAWLIVAVLVIILLVELLKKSIFHPRARV